jgi:hypothetical protein
MASGLTPKVTADINEAEYEAVSPLKDWTQRKIDPMRNPAQGRWPFVIAWPRPLEVKDFKTWMLLFQYSWCRFSNRQHLRSVLRSYATYQHFITQVSSSPEDHTHTPIQQFTVSNLMLVIIQTPSREIVCAVCVAGNMHQIPIIFVGPV